MKKSCFDYAIHYVSRYPKTVFGLHQKLLEKEYEEEEIVATIHRLQELLMLNDAHYAENYLRSEVVRKGKPLFGIQQKLRIKGVDKDTITNICDELTTELEEGMQTKISKEINRFLEKGLTKHAILQKLQARGYPFTLISTTYENIEETALSDLDE